MTLNTMIEKYNSVAYTHNYIFGFRFKGIVYFVSTNEEILPEILCLDKASRGCGNALRFCPNKAIKENLVGMAKPLCTEEEFNSSVENSIYNKGEIFEKLVTEMFGLVWEKDNIPFTKAGDVEVNGVAYQIKYERATFCNDKSLARLVAQGKWTSRPFCPGAGAGPPSGSAEARRVSQSSQKIFLKSVDKQKTL